MAAADSLSQRQLWPHYHGTHQEFAPGDLITTGKPRAADAHIPGISEHVYATADLSWAKEMADLGASARNSRRRRVYAVEPMGHLEDDPYDQHKQVQSVRSEAPMRVVGEVARSHAFYGQTNRTPWTEESTKEAEKWEALQDKLGQKK